MAVLVPDKKLDHIFPNKIFPSNQNNLAYHPGPVSPPGGDGSLLFNKACDTCRRFYKLLIFIEFAPRQFPDRCSASEVVRVLHVLRGRRRQRLQVTTDFLHCFAPKELLNNEHQLH